MRRLLFILSFLFLFSCSPQEDPCFRATETASLAITEHRKFIIAVADAADGWKRGDRKAAAAAKARAGEIGAGMEALTDRFVTESAACSRSRGR